MLTSALDHYRRQQRITVAGLQAARRAQKQGPVATARVVTAFQLAAGRDAVDSVPLMLREQGIPDEPVGEVITSSVAGTASDGRPLDTLFQQAETDQQFDLMVVTQLQDVARILAGIAIVSRPNVTGYVRMLNPPSCARCAILAGKFFKANKGFQRHPRCDCRHVPSTEALAGDLTTDPKAYFDSLSPGEQQRIFTNKGAEAIRDGADMAQVVNVRAGMSAAGTTRTATRVINGETYVVNVSRRTLSGSHLPGKGGGGLAPAPESGPDLLAFWRPANEAQQKAATLGRMTPEGIYDVAKNRAHAIRLLKEHGYIT